MGGRQDHAPLSSSACQAESERPPAALGGVSAVPGLSLSPGWGPGVPPRALQGSLPSRGCRSARRTRCARLPLPTPHVCPARKCLECVRLWTRILSIYSPSVHRMPSQLFPGQQLLPSLITSPLVASDPNLGTLCPSTCSLSSLISWRLPCHLEFSGPLDSGRNFCS